MLKKIILSLIMLVIAILLAVYIINIKPNFSIKIVKPKMIWGTVIRPYALDGPGGSALTWKQSIDKQINYCQQLGINTLRISMESDDQVIDYIISQASKNNLDILLVLEISGQNPVSDGSEIDFLQAGYNLAKDVAKKYKGKIKYYQLANEISGTIFNKPEDRGETLDDRYGQRYNKTRTINQIEYLKGMSQAIKEEDFNALRVVTAHWISVDAIKYMIDGGVDFEIVGWDWYSDMGNDFTNRDLEKNKNFNLVKIVNGEFKKELWIVETNKDKGSWNNTEKEQADFISSIAEISWKNKVKGFFIHMLVDMAPEQQESIGHLGLVKVNNNEGNLWNFADLKPAFYTYQEVIKKYPFVK